MTARYTYGPGEWATLGNEWRISLQADNKAPKTIETYLYAVRRLGEWAYEQDGKPEPSTITTTQIREFIRETLERSSAGTARNYYRCLSTFFGWLVDEDEITLSPMAKTRPPQVPDKNIPIVTLEQMAALLDVCKGKDFADRRDTAILRVLWDTGGRRAEVSYLQLDDLDMDTEAILVHGKGRRDRVVPFGSKTAQALSRYLRVRNKHSQAAMPALWLGSTGQGALTHGGIKAVLVRRSRQAGIGHVHPHMFRHSLAHYWQAAHGNENDLMRIMGWKSREMLSRYGASAAVERAHATARALRLGDRVRCTHGCVALERSSATHPSNVVRRTHFERVSVALVVPVRSRCVRCGRPGTGTRA